MLACTIVLFEVFGEVFLTSLLMFAYGWCSHVLFRHGVMEQAGRTKSSLWMSREGLTKTICRVRGRTTRSMGNKGNGEVTAEPMTFLLRMKKFISGFGVLWTMLSGFF